MLPGLGLGVKAHSYSVSYEDVRNRNLWWEKDVWGLEDEDCGYRVVWMVDATAFPLSVPLHKSKTLKEDAFPKPFQYNAEVSIDLFSFIHHADPTKVRVGEIDKASDQVSLLEATRGRVVLLAPPVPVTATSSKGNMTESIDRLFDEGNGAEKEHSTEGCEYVSLTEAIVEPVNEDVAEKPRRLKKKRKASGDASGSTLPQRNKGMITAPLVLLLVGAPCSIFFND
nr:hypothetical protein [Tanacetum cinerariifolium]